MKAGRAIPGEDTPVPEGPDHPGKRIRVLNPGTAASEKDLMPLSACDCDNHTHCHVHTDVCVADEVNTDVDVDACGIWG